MIKGKLEIIKGDITTMEVDAIVNASNNTLQRGGGVSAAIHQAAGPDLLAATRQLVGLKTGEAKITRAFKLPAKYVIHTAGPAYQPGKDQSRLLRSAYQASLEVAKENNLKTIAFPSISTGIYAYPLAEAVPVAVQAVVDTLSEPGMEGIERVIFVAHSDQVFYAYQQELTKL